MWLIKLVFGFLFTMLLGLFSDFEHYCDEKKPATIKVKMYLMLSKKSEMERKCYEQIC